LSHDVEKFRATGMTVEGMSFVTQNIFFTSGRTFLNDPT
jgi:hypothetical protein